MIKTVEIITNAQPQTELEKSILRVFNGIATKLNEVIDVINNIQKEREAERFEIQEWIGILEAVRKSVNKHGKLIDTLVEENNIHEEQIDELQMKVEPEKCESIENATISKMENVDPYAEQRKALDKSMEHITGLNNMIESWYKLLQSDKDTSTKYAILKSAISAYVENKGGDNE